MEKFVDIKEKIKARLDNVKYDGDLSDIGNEIGIVLGMYLTTDDEFNDFIHGLKHGVSLTNGTH
jgi:hypothetical protein